MERRIRDEKAEIRSESAEADDCSLCGLCDRHIRCGRTRNDGMDASAGAERSVCDPDGTELHDGSSHRAEVQKMEEKIRLRIIALEDAMTRTSSKYLKRDLWKQIRKLKADLKRLEKERKANG